MQKTGTPTSATKLTYKDSMQSYIATRNI